MVVGDRGDNRGQRLGDDVRGIEAPAEPGLEEGDIGGVAGEGQHGGGGRHLEEGGGLVAIHALDLLQQVRQPGIVDQRAAKPDPLVEPDQMG